MPTSVIGRVTGALPTTMSPVVRASSPATMSIRVLLPQPEAPTTEMNSPGGIETLTSLSARNGRSLSSPKIFDTFRRTIGTPDLVLGARAISARAIISSARGVHDRPRRCDRIERHFGDQQDFAALLDDRVVLLDHLDIER